LSNNKVTDGMVLALPLNTGFVVCNRLPTIGDVNSTTKVV